MRCWFVALLVGCVLSTSFAADWPQFRGPNATGVPADDLPLPSEVGPEKNVLWKTELPPGHSSPVLAGDRIYLTAITTEKDAEKKLLTLGLDRATGKILWQEEAPHDTLEVVHTTGSLAQPTPASDGEIVVSFFGSSGLLAYDKDGKLLWQRRLGPYKNDFGAGSSPILVGDRVILCQDHDQESHIVAYDKRSGEELWKTPRDDAQRNYCTPVVWEQGGRQQIVVAGTLQISGYEAEDGRELWNIGGISRMVCMTPVVAKDRIYVAGWSAGGDEGARIKVPTFDQVLSSTDKNGDGQFSDDELAAGDIKQRFTQVDRDKNGLISKAEYERFRNLFDLSQNVVLALKPATGDPSQAEIAWSQTKFIPFCCSPVLYRNVLFCCKDGGIVTTLDAATGKALKNARSPATGNYYASLVAGDGKVFLANEEGKLTILSAEPQWKVLSTAEFGEGIYATPAIADGKLYVRTTGHLYCFGK
jgi:outer membrane protein assembly factor BamB